MKTSFFGVTSRKCLHVFFCKRWALFSEVKQRWTPILLGFSGILPRFPGILPRFLGILPRFLGILSGFLTYIKSVGGALAPPPPTTLAVRVGVGVGHSNSESVTLLTPVVREADLWE